jgi:hypothetical protein
VQERPGVGTPGSGKAAARSGRRASGSGLETLGSGGRACRSGKRPAAPCADSACATTSGGCAAVGRMRLRVPRAQRGRCQLVAANPDFKDLFVALCGQQAEFIVVGAHAVMIFTEPRYTKDLAVWIRPSSDNAARAYRALIAFGAPMSDLTEADLATPGVIFQIGTRRRRRTRLDCRPASSAVRPQPRAA